MWVVKVKSNHTKSSDLHKRIVSIVIISRYLTKCFINYLTHNIFLPCFILENKTPVFIQQQSETS